MSILLSGEQSGGCCNTLFTINIITILGKAKEEKNVFKVF
jgi:hypothetical protein